MASLASPSPHFPPTPSPPTPLQLRLHLRSGHRYWYWYRSVMVRIGYGSCIGSAIALIWYEYRSLSVAATADVAASCDAVRAHVCVCVRSARVLLLLRCDSFD